MKPEDVRHLIGGYASGTLSEAEKKLLFEAAMEDQVLFDALADEQALKDLLDDPESRGYLQAALEEEPVERPVLDAPMQSRVRSVMAPAPVPLATSGGKPAAVVSETAAAPPPPNKRPVMGWGLLAAAALATVSVVGILKMAEKPAGKSAAGQVEMAKNTPPAAETSRPAPVVSNPVPPKTAAESKPQTFATKPTPKIADKDNEADKAVAVAPEPVTAERDDRRREAIRAGKQAEAEKTKDESETRPPSMPAAPARAAAPQPPPPEQARKESSAQQNQQQSPMVNNQQALSQNQVDQLKQLPAVPGARQLYFSEPQAAPSGGGADSKAVTSAAGPAAVQTESAPAKKSKSAATASARVGLAGRSSTNAPGTAVALARAGFAMRYKILRKSGQDFVAVLPGTRFHVGDEVVLVIEKNSGGVATIERIADGATTAVPLAIQTNEMARSVPLMVSGPMELALVLNRADTLPSGVPVQPAGQKVEVADGMVYVGELSNAAGKPLVIRVPIRVDSAPTK